MLVTRIPEHVQNVMARLEAAGWEAWCVGGGVRDMLLGRDPGDWDVTTSARPEDVKMCIRDSCSSCRADAP